jgi:hypothetical protein
MEEKNFEILKRKRIRKLLLLKINDELKEIQKKKSNIRINSKTIQEINQLYNRSDILLFEKSTVYFNYIKTEEKIISRCGNRFSPVNMPKKEPEINKNINNSNNKNNKNNKANKNKSKRNEKLDTKSSLIEVSYYSIEEDSASAVISYVPKKIELGRKKLIVSKSKVKNNETNQSIHKKKVNSDKELLNQNLLNKSTKIGAGDLHLHKLIEKITAIKNNESTEGIIRENLKKLRKYCYQLRKKKKKVRKDMAKRNSSFRKKDKEKRDIFRKRNTITNKDKEIFKHSFFINMQKKMESNIYKSNPKIDIRKSPAPILNFDLNMRKKSTAKITKKTNNIKLNPRLSSKNQRFYSSIKAKEKGNQKEQKLNESFGLKFMKKLNKKMIKKSLKVGDNNHEESIPLLTQIPKGKSTYNENKLKFDFYNININNDGNDKNKIKNSKIKYYKKNLNKDGSIKLIYTKEEESEDQEHKYFNKINHKKDKVELHDNMFHKSHQKIKKFDSVKKDNLNFLKNNDSENNEEIIRLKKLSIVLDSRKKLKKKLIDSPDRKGYRFSNFTNYNTFETNTNTTNQISHDKIGRSLIKKNKKSKEKE